MTAVAASTLAQLGDRAAIAAVLQRWCRAIDRRDAALMQTVFHPDALITNGRDDCGSKEYIERAASRHAGIPKSSHMIGNVNVEFVGPDAAFCETWCHALEAHPAQGDRPALDRLVRMRYADEFARRDGAWRIARRTAVIDHEVWLPAPERDTAAEAGRLVGLRSADDPIEQVRRRLGLA